ncbi:hypothetical protein GCK72_001747 [Caenorhabditis remanei]|uniref:Uncharacterized protein n=1 Tax=Caenorhabditis remanei TaxID=31234 RepID=A0A6A5HNX1_CAERE|nr:hypothetical protein GCK72_001747 [Caenorhabditis remanei]KAF1769930.1 hypothetical protein GCK72_001747 [Caenorhabditis remanei]
MLLVLEEFSGNPVAKDLLDAVIELANLFAKPLHLSTAGVGDVDSEQCCNKLSPTSNLGRSLANLQKKRKVSRKPPEENGRSLANLREADGLSQTSGNGRSLANLQKKTEGLSQTSEKQTVSRKPLEMDGLSQTSGNGRSLANLQKKTEGLSQTSEKQTVSRKPLEMDGLSQTSGNGRSLVNLRKKEGRSLEHLRKSTCPVLKCTRHRAVSGSKYGSLDYNRPRAESWINGWIPGNIRHRAVFVDQQMDPWYSQLPVCEGSTTDAEVDIKSENMIVGSNAISIPLGLTSNVEDVTMVGTTSTQPTGKEFGSDNSPGNGDERMKLIGQTNDFIGGRCGSSRRFGTIGPSTYEKQKKTCDGIREKSSERKPFGLATTVDYTESGTSASEDGSRNPVATILPETEKDRRLLSVKKGELAEVGSQMQKSCSAENNYVRFNSSNRWKCRRPTTKPTLRLPHPWEDAPSKEETVKEERRRLFPGTFRKQGVIVK